MLEDMLGNGWKWIEIAGDYLGMHGDGLSMLVYAWECLEMAGNGWKLFGNAWGLLGMMLENTWVWLRMT